MKFDIVELFKDIGIKIIDEKPELSILKDLTIIGVESCCPKIAPAINAGNVIITRLEDYKLKYLLYGLSNGKNVEMHINMLRNYVMSSSERAYRVADVFKKTVVSESLNSCILLGAELAKKLKDDTDYTIDELIVCKALENAIDYDLKCFKELMTNCVSNEHDGKRRIVYKTQNKDKIHEYNMTCSWAISSRLFSERESEWAIVGGDENEDTIQTKYYVEKSADILLELIYELNQVWRYDW